MWRTRTNLRPRCNIHHLLACVVAWTSVVACGGTSSSEDTTHDPATVQRGCDLYFQHCVDCHGDGARGDGIHQQHLNPPPADLLSAASRSKSGDEYYTRIAGVGLPPSGMPAFAELMTETEIRDTIAFVDALADGVSVSCDGSMQTTGGETNADTHAEGSHTGEESSSGATTATTDPTGGSGSTSGGPAGSTSEGEESTGGPVDPACASLCDCVDASCSTLPGYPFDSSADCLDQCTGFTAEETACWGGFCAEITDNPALADHLCEHAWGGLGLQEC